MMVDISDILCMVGAGMIGIGLWFTAGPYISCVVVGGIILLIGLDGAKG